MDDQFIYVYKNPSIRKQVPQEMVPDKVSGNND